MKTIDRDTKNEILARLENVYGVKRPALNFKNPYELLVATILSAQCTDVRVNKITVGLFEKYPNSAALAQADFDELAEIIHSCGVYNMKAKNLIGTAKMIEAEYGGHVPRTMEQLTKLPGVGRKTANVVLSNAFDVPAIAVDTHVFRVSKRIGLASGKNVALTETELNAAIPTEKWSEAHHWLIYHGRQICSARKPKCATCFLNDICPYEDKTPEAVV